MLLTCDPDGWLREAIEGNCVREASDRNALHLLRPVGVGARECARDVARGDPFADWINNDLTVPRREFPCGGGVGDGRAMRLDKVAAPIGAREVGSGSHPSS